jgi:hypothetical protein
MYRTPIKHRYKLAWLKMIVPYDWLGWTWCIVAAGTTLWTINAFIVHGYNEMVSYRLYEQSKLPS